MIKTETTCVVVLLTILSFLTSNAANGQATPDQRRPNVLFIAVDDLRPELGCYGKTHMHTPHLDALANRSVMLERAYCMVPTCGASRSSLMTGIRPSRNRFVSFRTRADQDAPAATTLNTHFKNQGYLTVSNGKVFHHAEDSAAGWSEKPWRPNANAYRLPANRERQGTRDRNGKTLRGPAWENADAPDAEYADAMTAEKSIADLKRLAQQEQPFFLAVGFMKPHLPFVAPKKYWDLYDHDQIKLPENYLVPNNAPEQAIHNSGELRAYQGIPAKGPVSDQTARQLIHGYYACVSFVDAQIGRLLQELDQLELAENTIVVVWGDHGWNLGDHTLWCKHSCFESSMHAPLMFAAPGLEGGKKSPGLVEFIDIYPTLCELAGLPAPAHLEGQSLEPLLKQPQREWKPFAIGRFQAGDTIRTDQYRYSRYTNPNGKLLAEMMYDHSGDPMENENVVKRIDQREPAERLKKWLSENLGKDKSTREEK